MSDSEKIVEAIDTALARSGGVIVVRSETQKLRAASALSRMAPKHLPPVDVNKIAITVDESAENPYYRRSL